MLLAGLGMPLGVSAQIAPPASPPVAVPGDAPFTSTTSAHAFVDGDRVLFLGDSITHNGYYPYYLEHYYATRFPDRTITFRNGGISGGKAPDAELRLGWDVLAWHPTQVLINLGMNDIGTSHYLAAPAEGQPPITPEQRDATTDSLVTRYEETMARILDRLTAERLTVTLTVPTPYDQTGTQQRPNSLGKNDAIRRLGAWLATTATARSLALVDLNTPLLVINSRLQATDVAATAISPDRVHPGKAGHLIATAMILRAQGLAGPPLWQARLNATTGEVSGADGVRVDAFESGDYAGAARFDVTPARLPWTFDATAEGDLKQSAREALAWDPAIGEEFDRMMMAIDGLEAGEWEALIDGHLVARADSSAWAAGVDLGAAEATPWQTASQELLKVILEKRDEERTLRGVAWIRSRVFDPRGTDVADLAACDAAIAEWKASSDYRESNERYVQEYLKYRDPATIAAIEARIADLNDTIATWPAPDTATVEIRKAK